MSRYDPRDDLRPARPDLGRIRPSVRPRSGHRREARRKESPRSFEDRLNGALLDVAMHRAVAYRDIVDAHFGGHPYAARRGVDRLKRAGHLRETRVKGPNGGQFSVLSATRGGAKLAERVARHRGLDARQRAWSGLGKPGDLAHDVAIYRAARDARSQLEDRGFKVSRVLLDAELRGLVARRSEKARARGGRRAADAERRLAARELGLPVRADGRVLYPDAQLVYSHPDQRDPGRVNIEIATEHYREGAVAEKALAGFAVYGANGNAGRVVSSGLRKAAAALATAGRDGTGGGFGRGDDPASVEL